MEKYHTSGRISTRKRTKYHRSLTLENFGSRRRGQQHWVLKESPRGFANTRISEKRWTERIYHQEGTYNGPPKEKSGTGLCLPWLREVRDPKWNI